MVSGFEIWGHDPNLRAHWKNRFLAFIVDAIISFVPVSITLYMLGITDILEVGIIVSTIFYIASSIPESLTGSTPGKYMFHLRVHAIDGGPIAARVWFRNLSRLFWFMLPPLDFTLGLATRGDPRQRMLDRAAGTKVVHGKEKERYASAMEALAAEPEAGNGDGVETNETGAAAENPEDTDRPITEDRCRECGGKLILLADDKLQCDECGLIQ